MSESLLRKPLTGILLLAGAAGGPYMMFETKVGQQASTQLFGDGQTTGASSQGGTQGGNGEFGSYVAWDATNATVSNATVSNATQLHPLNPALQDLSLQQPAIHTLSEVLRFDISPGWVMGNFPRVSTVLADTQLDGLRVPLVTGTAPSDLAGTLTYSFDRFHRLQRLTVQGATGDATRFIAELQQHYQMQQVPSLGGLLYQLSWNGQATSIVHVEPASVIYADAAYSRFNVLIELNQPGLEYGLSQEARRLLDAGKNSRRW